MTHAPIPRRIGRKAGGRHSLMAHGVLPKLEPQGERRAFYTAVGCALKRWSRKLNPHSLQTVFGRDNIASCVYARSSKRLLVAAKTELPMALRAAYLALHRRSDLRFAQLGVTADQFVLLARLADGQALTQRELARRMPSDPSTVRAMLVLLERSGLVERKTHSTDARARTVALTAAGKRKFRQLWSASESIRTQMVEALQPDEAQTLLTLLTRVTEALNPDSVPVSSANTL